MEANKAYLTTRKAEITRYWITGQKARELVIAYIAVGMKSV
jgi:hypothetical protein